MIYEKTSGELFTPVFIIIIITIMILIVDRQVWYFAVFSLLCTLQYTYWSHSLIFVWLSAKQPPASQPAISNLCGDSVQVSLAVFCTSERRRNLQHLFFSFSFIEAWFTTSFYLLASYPPPEKLSSFSALNAPSKMLCNHWALPTPTNSCETSKLANRIITRRTKRRRFARHNNRSWQNKF